MIYADRSQAEYCLSREADLAAKPSSIDYLLATMTPISALEAWQGLIDHAGVGAGERVLIHGAAGVVGIFATQLARWRGARIT